MRIIKFILAVIVFWGIINAEAQRISGYFPNYNYTASNYLNIQWGKMTHLYYFSLNPTRTAVGQSDGSLWYNDPYSWFTTTYFTNVINQARAVNPNIKILIVSGGAPGGDTDLNTRFNYIASNASRRNTFCNNIINFIKTYNLDGWDLDWEFPDNSTARNNHEALLATMKQKIDSLELAECKNYEITIAVGGGYTDRIPKTCWNPAHTDYVNANVINYVDYVNIMTYDGNIGSPPCSFSSHQHYDLVVKALGDWVADFPTWPKSKMQIGVGFYNNAHTAFSSGGNNSTYYNQTYWPTGGSGCPNMQAKVDYARTQGTAGTFIWELTQDNLCSGTVPTCYSLLDCIYQRTISTWGTWTAPGNPCSMPVVLTAFYGRRVEGGNYISWATAEENDHEYFILESSFDGIHFEQLARVNSDERNSAGAAYSWQGTQGSEYYRLKMVSRYGDVEYSNVIRVENKSLSGIETFPNPFNDQISIVLPPEEEVLELSIMNASGQKIFFLQNLSERELSLGSEWPQGIYFLKVTTGGKSSVIRLIKQ